MNKSLPSLPKECPFLYISQLQSLAPIQGQSRVEFEDFIVEELPLYEPCGEGEHCYLWIEKRGISTRAAIRKLSRALGKRERDFGYAGLKDAQGITRQHLSIVHHGEAEDLLAASTPKIQILAVKRHQNKVRVGHLRGNRFQIRLRNGASGDLPRALSILTVLKEQGVPNYFGLQRFGQHQNSHRLGEALVTKNDEAFLGELLGPHLVSDAPARSAYLAGDATQALKLWPKHEKGEIAALRSLVKDPSDLKRAIRAIPSALRFFYCNALQSFLFNRYLSRVLEEGKSLQQGSIAVLDRNGAAFPVEDLEQERPRLSRFEIHPSGPLFGASLLRPHETSPDRRLEDEILTEAGLTLSDFEAPSLKLKGQRRPLRIPLGEPQVKEGQESGSLELSFTLPKGSYATSVLSELMQKPIA